jgi:acetylornithine/succinyldiaminopimelate/putrescine aminotransferase
MGRTGSFFAWQHFGVKPDALSMAKAVANGFPMGVLLASEKYSKILTPGTHASTFGGTPLACAAACAVIDTYDKENILENVRARSAFLQEKLQSFVGKYPCVKGVRGLGLMIGLLLDRPAGSVLASLRAKGMIALSAGETVLRLVPPLTVTQEDCEKAINLIDQALAEVTAG